MAQALRTQSSRPAAQGRAAQATTLRVETAGYGGVPVRAVVPSEALSSIERGDLPVETEVKMRVPGYGWRVVEARVYPGCKEGIAGETSAAQVTVPGYGHAPLRMSFLEGKRSRTQPLGSKWAE